MVGGATKLVAGGGFSGGSAISLENDKVKGGENGFSGGHTEDSDKIEYFYSGGGYLQGPDGNDTKKVNRSKKCLGGFYSVSENKEIIGSTGGISGSGGIVILSGKANLNAYNGNRYTDKSQTEYTVIYSQSGKTIERYDYKKVNGMAFTLSRVSKSKKVKTTDYGQGIGSGAGYIEGNNGRFKDNTKNK